jgi:hypothetical protein
MQWTGNLSVRRAVTAICIGAFFSNDSASGIHSYDTLGQTSEVLLRYTATHRIMLLQFSVKICFPDGAKFQIHPFLAE